MKHRLLLLGAIASVAPLAWACAPPELGATPARVQAATGSHGCDAVKDPLHPFIIDWEATSRARLEAAAEIGPVIVHYEGCALKVLSECHVKEAARYETIRTTPAEDRIDMSSKGDLYANLPLAVAALEGELARSGGLSLAYVTVGERLLSRAPTLLEGDCAGATHYVESMVLGAFDLESRSATSGAAAVRAMNLGAGGGGATSRDVAGSAGDVATCKQKGLDAAASCGAILQLGLRPLQQVGDAFVEPAMGPTVAELSVIPALGDLEPARRTGVLEKVDVGVLELLQAAKQADADRAKSSREKARAWDALAQRHGDNPYRAAAERRRDEWQRIADTQERRLQGVLQACPRYDADREKLRRLLALDDAVLPARDKARYKERFALAYGPWKADLERCEAKAPEVTGDGMVSVPAGAFSMGRAPGRMTYINYPDPRDTGPVHVVAVGAFSMDVTEVTVGAYRRCVEAHACTVPLDPAAIGCTWRSGKDDLPVDCVDREQARAYCRWAGKRLPTEEEWEYAARPDGRTYPWGEMPRAQDDLAKLVCWGHGKQPCPVRSFPRGASPFGLQDMAGNVWEWTDSDYSADYTRQLVSGWAVIRGGASASPVSDVLRATYRGAIDPNRRVEWVGFRCAR